MKRDQTPLTDEELNKLKESLELLAECDVYLRSFDGLIARVEKAESSSV